MTKTLALILGVAALAAGCGGDDGDQTGDGAGTGPSAQTQAQEQTPTAAPTTEQADPAEPASENCGDIDGGPGGGDAVADLQATGVDCETARQVARAAKIEGADTAPAGFDCPDAQTYAAEEQTCTKGDASITWRVVFE